MNGGFYILKGNIYYLYFQMPSYLHQKFNHAETLLKQQWHGMFKSSYPYALVLSLFRDSYSGGHLSNSGQVSMPISTITVKGKKCKPSPAQTYSTSNLKAWKVLKWSSHVGFSFIWATFLYPQMRKTDT